MPADRPESVRALSIRDVDTIIAVVIFDNDMVPASSTITQALSHGALSSRYTLSWVQSRNPDVRTRFGALGKLARGDYHTALRERVLIPLGMANTSTGKNDEQAAHLATAHRTKLAATKHWDFTEVTVAAGGLRSSLSDMLRFLKANVHPEQSGMADELAIMRQPSKLPECGANPGKYTFVEQCIRFTPVAIVVPMAVIEVCVRGRQWLTRFGPDGLLHFFIMLLPTLAAAIRWGRVPGAATLVLMTFLTWWLWGPTIAWFSELI
jgi:hypothetical protein